MLELSVSESSRPFRRSSDGASSSKALVPYGSNSSKAIVAASAGSSFPPDSEFREGSVFREDTPKKEVTPEDDRPLAELIEKFYKLNDPVSLADTNARNAVTEVQKALIESLNSQDLYLNPKPNETTWDKALDSSRVDFNLEKIKSVKDFIKDLSFRLETHKSLQESVEKAVNSLTNANFHDLEEQYRVFRLSKDINVPNEEKLRVFLEKGQEEFQNREGQVEATPYISLVASHTTYLKSEIEETFESEGKVLEFLTATQTKNNVEIPNGLSYDFAKFHRLAIEEKFAQNISLDDLQTDLNERRNLLRLLRIRHANMKRELQDLNKLDLFLSKKLENSKKVSSHGLEIVKNLRGPESEDLSNESVAFAMFSPGKKAPIGVLQRMLIAETQQYLTIVLDRQPHLANTYNVLYDLFTSYQRECFVNPDTGLPE